MLQRAVRARGGMTWRAVKRKATLCGNLCLLIVLFGLDVRDLYFKLSWLGPYDSFRFATLGTVRFDQKPMQLAFQVPNSHQLSKRASGWSSFYHSCDALHGSKFFINVLGKNCSIGDEHDHYVAESLVMNAAVRADSFAWASCKLLHFHRRPPICQERMVTRFLKRYSLEDRHVPASEMSPVDSHAEIELLQLLGVISRSAPTFRLICVQAFVYSAAGAHQPNLYGCGNPSIMESAFAGLAASYLGVLLRDMAWLTRDTLDVMGLQIRIRENSRSDFVMSDPARWPNTGSTRTTINFSMSGQLYAFMVTVDVALAVLYFRSAIEILRLILVPTLMGSSTNRLPGDDSSLFSMFSRSLYRSRPVVMLTVLSHLISWQITLPNAVVWTWSISQNAKLVAYLSSIRVWVLLLIAFNSLWDLVALCSERWAYTITRRTYLTPFELMAIGAGVAYASRTELFSMGEEKYTLERQRWVDGKSFTGGAVGYANVYDDDHDGVGLLPGQFATNTRVLRIVYGPLVTILGRSIGCLIAFLALKMLYLRCSCGRRREPVEPTGTRDACSNQLTHEYERMPIEALLCIPIRAKSLIRGAFELESAYGDVSYVPAPLGFDFGVVVEPRTGTLRTRIGFVGNLIDPRLDADACGQNDSDVTQMPESPWSGPD